MAEVRRLVEQLSELHAQLGESIPRDEDSPFLATWLISGRILQLADGFVFMVEAGYGAETIALDRAMLELSILVLGLNRDPAMVQMWLDDKWVPPRRAREALKRPAPFWSDDLRARRAEVEKRAARGEIAEAEAADLISTLVLAGKNLTVRQLRRISPLTMHAGCGCTIAPARADAPWATSADITRAKALEPG